MALHTSSIEKDHLVSSLYLVYLYLPLSSKKDNEARHVEDEKQKERSYPESNRGRPDVLHHRSDVDQNRK